MLINKSLRLFVLTLASLVPVFMAHAQDDQENKAPDPAEMAEMETSRLEKALKLEDWQVFYVDSTLRHDYVEWMAEMQKLQRARVENSDLYLALQDKWMIRIEESYQKIFTPEQWKNYLKQGGERIINDRKKREEKRLKATDSKKAQEIKEEQNAREKNGADVRKEVRGKKGKKKK